MEVLIHTILKYISFDIYSIWKRDEANMKVIDDMQEYKYVVLKELIPATKNQIKCT